MGRYLDLCETVEVDAIEPTHPRDLSDISDQSPPAFEPAPSRDISDISDESPPTLVVPGVKRSVIEGGLEPAAPAEWTPQAWVDHYEERAAIIEHDGELPRQEAERQALADTINQWLVMHPPPATDDATGCVHCGQPLGDDGVPVLAGGAHTWLHSRCHPPWLAERRAEAERALAAMGVAAALARRSRSG